MRSGPGAEALLGRRVVGVTVGVQGGYASAALLDAATVQTLPSWLSFVDGVAMYFPYLLGWLALRERGRVKAGDVVLVHAGAGGVGSGVVQLAKAFGAIVIATAGSDEKVEFCRQLGADHAVNYRDGDFVGYVDDVTNGRGVDIAFDSVGGQVTTDTFRTMAFNGRHLIVGFAADITLEEQPVSLQPSIYGNFDLVGICFSFVDDPRLTQSLGMNFLTRADGIRIWGNILQMTQCGQIRPVVGREIEFAEVPAHARGDRASRNHGQDRRSGSSAVRLALIGHRRRCGRDLVAGPSAGPSAGGGVVTTPGRPNHRWTRLEPNSDFDSISVCEGPSKSPTGAAPAKNVTSTVATLPSPNSR